MLNLHETMRCSECGETGEEEPRQCRDCDATFCPSCFGKQHTVVQTAKLAASGGWKRLVCLAHGRMLAYTCGQDGELVCSRCLFAVGGGHEQHTGPTRFYYCSFDFK